MAKVKTAKEKITAYLKGKGLDASEIRDAFDELDAADVDLDKLADAATKNEQWNTWYQQTAPEIQKISAERDTYKKYVEQLEAAGFKVSGDGNVTPQNNNTNNNQNPGYITAEQLQQFQTRLAGASSDVMKKLMKVSFKHYKRFGSEPDMDAIEKLMGEKDQFGRPRYSDVEDAYRVWSKPMREERRKTRTEKEVSQKIQEGIQAEMSKRGIVGARKRTDDIEPAPLDKPAPSDKDLRDAFIADMNSTAN